MQIELGEELFLNPSGGGGGSDANITMTQTNPKIPKDVQPLTNAMLAIATAMQGAPVNFGAIPGLDAPATRMPMANLGSMLANPYFNAGASRTSPMFATGPYRPPNSGGGYGNVIMQTPGSPSPQPSIPEPVPSRRDIRREERIQRRQERRDQRRGMGDILAA